jgi:osmotically inducible protein OsmC
VIKIWSQQMLVLMPSSDRKNKFYGLIRRTEMPTRNADAVWEGSLKDGKGTMKVGSGAFEGAYTWSSRYENGKGTNPEELLGAAHAGCYTMSLSSNLGKAGFTPQHIHTSAKVTIELVDGKNRITHIALETEARVPGIGTAQFLEIAEAVKTNCPVSVALASVPMSLTARLLA